MFLIALYHVKSSFPDLTFFAAAILDFSNAILKLGPIRLAKDKYSNNSCSLLFLPSFLLISACAFFLSLSALLNI